MQSKKLALTPLMYSLVSKVVRLMNKPLTATDNHRSCDHALDHALAEARQEYITTHPRSLAAHEEAKAAMPGGNTRTVLYHDPFPLRIISGSDATITDADGFKYVNFLGEYTAGLFGHSHPIIREAIDNALDSGLNLSGHNAHEIALAKILCNRFPSLEKIRFTNSGTEANLMAIATACFFTNRKKVLVFNGGYHGGLLYFGGGGIPINAPHDFVLGTYNDCESAQQLIEQHKEELACILVEPMMGSGGCIPADKAFLSTLRQSSEACGAVLIFDEVMTSRLTSGGAQQHFEITPDMTTLGKYIAGGMTFGAFGGRTELMEIYNPEISTAMPHAGTFNNNTLSMAAGVAAMGKIYTADIAKQLNNNGDQLRETLNQIALEANAPIQFTGIGSLMNLHGTRNKITSPKDLTTSDDRIKQLIFLDMLSHGYYFARRGFVALMLSITDDHSSGFIRAFRQVLKKREHVLQNTNK